MKKFLTLITTLAVLAPAYAYAMDLSSAKQAGLVGERQDGLVGAVISNPTAETQSLINETNVGRMAVYNDTAIKQSVPLSQVQALAAEKLYSLVGSGQYVMTNGQWVKK